MLFDSVVDIHFNDAYTFVAIGNDVTLFANATSKLLADFKAVEPAKGAGEAKVY